MACSRAAASSRGNVVLFFNSISFTSASDPQRPARAHLVPIVDHMLPPVPGARAECVITGVPRAGIGHVPGLVRIRHLPAGRHPGGVVVVERDSLPTTLRWRRAWP